MTRYVNPTSSFWQPPPRRRDWQRHAKDGPLWSASYSPAADFAGVFWAVLALVPVVVLVCVAMGWE